MSGYWHVPDDYAYEPPVVSGSAHSVSGDAPDRDPAEKVREIAEKIARKPIPRPAPRRMGFF